MLLKDKVAIITGIGPGMGAEIARLFAREGAKLTIGARTESKLQELAAELRSQGAEVIVQPTDLTSETSCQKIVEATMEAYGRVDILVQNGHDPGDYTMVEQADIEQWRRVLDCNLFGALYLLKACLPSMTAHGDGRVVFVNSGASFEPHPTLASYAAAKAALASLVRSAAIELGPKGVRTNGIHLGLVEGVNVETWVASLAQTEGKTEEQVRAEIVAREYPVGHIPRPEECAGSVLYLVSDLSKAVIGQSLMVNGGALLR
jgi:NAD(P)-dependent dehydrogenase (short-subunit alcohol dehydrogenase family)